MRRFILLGFILQVLLVTAVRAQNDSSVVKPVEVQKVNENKKDSGTTKTVRKTAVLINKIKPDTAASRKVLIQTEENKDSLAFILYGVDVQWYIATHPYYNTDSSLVYMPSQRYSSEKKDELFYIFCSVLLFLGILRVGFPKYFQDIFDAFWRSGFRQKQIRDQIQQAGMTTLLFNFFFVFSIALFGYLVTEHTKGVVKQTWLVFATCFFGIAVVYVGKYFILKTLGWMFGEETAMDNYIFIVYLINKILSVILIPFMLVIAFADPNFQQVAFTTSIILIFFLFVYRFILAYSILHNELKISMLHLFLYVCGFEIIPVLVIYKVVVHLFDRSS